MYNKRTRWDSDSSSDDEIKKSKLATENNTTSNIGDISNEIEENFSENKKLEEKSNKEINRVGYNPLWYGCRSFSNYEKLDKIDEGTYGIVYRARDIESNEIVALKRVKLSSDALQEGFPITALREINILLSLRHPNILHVKEMIFGSQSNDEIFMVMEYFQSDMKSIMQSLKIPFSQSEVKYLLYQLLSGVEYMHRCWYIHRDLKPSNLLFNKTSGKLAICDFGLARKFGSPVLALTPNVVTLYYRAPELLLFDDSTTPFYSIPIDLWSVGCIFAEFLSNEPLFQSNSEIQHTEKIFSITGPPTHENWPDYFKNKNVSMFRWKLSHKNKLRSLYPTTSFSGGPYLTSIGFDLLSRLLTLDPSKRISAKEALEHDYFHEAPLPSRPYL